MYIFGALIMESNGGDGDLSLLNRGLVGDRVDGRGHVIEREVEYLHAGAAVLVFDGDGDRVSAFIGVNVVLGESDRAASGAARRLLRHHAGSAVVPSPQSMVAVCVFAAVVIVKGDRRGGDGPSLLAGMVMVNGSMVRSAVVTSMVVVCVTPWPF